MDLTPRQIGLFQEKILSWYRKSKRDLPWRRTRDPYKILVSEVMLQQTQVSRVIPKYEAWVTAFPTVEALAKASITDILTHWIGLGYNRRALYLQKAANILVSEYSENSVNQKIRHSDNQIFRKSELSEFSGKIRWPQTEKELVSLPGIGPYTARALLSFAFGKNVAVVDTNIKKVILVEIIKYKKDSGQVVDARMGARMTDKEFQDIADQLLPKEKSYEWNQALMDYASSVLKKEKIPIPKQSTYIGSDRYYRAKILKLLLSEKSISKKYLGKKLREDFSSDLVPWLEKLVISLQKDGLIVIKEKEIILA